MIENKNFSIKLNLARAIAASLVALGHIRGHFFLPYEQLTPDSHNFINYFLFFLTRLGHEAVIIFFVLSGYLVGGKLLEDHLNKEINYKKYFINRITRMWVVLIPALILGCVIDYLTLSLHMGDPININLNIKTFFGNLFFLQTIKFDTFGTNAPLWSLAYEFWYYIFWPITLYPFFLSSKIYIKMTGLIATGIIGYFFMPNIIALYPLWILGALIRIIKFKYSKINYLQLFFSIITIILLGLSNIKQTVIYEYLLAISFSILVLIWQNQNSSLLNQRVRKIAEYFSNFSFSLYAIHYFLMFFIFEITIKLFHLPIRLNEANFLNWLYYIIIVGIIYILCFFFYYFTERNTSSVRNWILNKK